ncbi:MAG: hypothetical protein U5L09_21355 [Bacteroidales bacterium]|nr:hypothetical protein [Bacteroidales bacterium]
MGRIGMAMARRCKGAYNMDIIYHSRQQKPQAEQELEQERWISKTSSKIAT